MSLFRTVKRFEKESKLSVELKAKLDKHETTFPEVQKVYEVAASELEEIGKRIAAAREAGLSLKDLNLELRAAQLKRERPLHNYKVVQGDLRCELENIVRPFINEKAESWQDELKKLSALRIFEEQSYIKDAEGNKTHVVKSNLKAVATFQEKLLASLTHLYAMTHSSIPEIETFNGEVEKELRGIDLSAETEIIKLEERSFNEISENQKIDPLKTVTAYPAGDNFIIVKKPDEQKDDLDARFNQLKAKVGFRPKP